MTNEDDYAIVTGINHYPSYNGLADLEGAVNDADAFVEWLTEKADVPGVNIQRIPSSPDSNEASLKRIVEAFDFFLDRFGELEDAVGRRLYIFLAGHGVGPNVEDAGLLPSDARIFKPAHHLAGRRFANFLRQQGVFHEILLFMDCCRDKLRGGHGGYFPYDEAEGDASANAVFHFYAFASGFNKKTRERDIDGNGRKRGIFTYTLLQGLQGNALQGGKLMASNLKQFLLKEFQDIYPPDFGRDFLIVGQPVADVHVHVTLHEPDRGLEILGPDFRPVSPGAAIASQMKFTLPAEQTYLFGVPSDAGGYLRKEIVDAIQEEVHVAL